MSAYSPYNNYIICELTYLHMLQCLTRQFNVAESLGMTQAKRVSSLCNNNNNIFYLNTVGVTQANIACGAV